MKRILTVSFIILFLSTGCTNNEDNSISPANLRSITNDNIISDKTYGELTFTNTSLIIEDNQTKLTTIVTNNSNNDFYVDIFNIYIKDEDNNVIETLIGYVGETIPTNESREIVSYTSLSLDDAMNIEYEIVN